MAADWPDRSWVTSAELAAIAGRDERTVLREIERGHLAAERAGGGRSPWVIERPEAERWLAAYDPQRVPRLASSRDPLDPIMKRLAGMPEEGGGQ